MLVDDCVRVRVRVLVCSIVCELVRSLTYACAPQFSCARANLLVHMHARLRMSQCVLVRVSLCACICVHARVLVCARTCADAWMHLYACCVWPMADSREASRRRGALKARPLRALATRTVAS